MNREELIQAYWKNKLDQEEKAEFDRLFETDPEFREAVAFHQDVNAAFSAMERERLKNKMRGFESELHPPTQRKYAMWLAAASVLVIVGVSLMTFFGDGANPEQLYADYFEPYENVVRPITRGESVETLAQATFIAYEKAEYEKAVAGFQTLYEQTQAPYYLLYQANALMANGQSEKAVPLLKKQLVVNDAFAEKSRWYLALAYLKTRTVPQSKRLLRKIVEESSFKAAEAQKILNQLE